MTKPCIFCDYDTHKGIIVSETDNFYSMPTLGQISDGGHMMIIPRHHYSCLGAMPEALFGELDEMHKALKEAIMLTCGERVVSFEHGLVGQSVLHAYMQLLPLADQGQIAGIVQKEFSVKHDLESLADLRGLHDTQGAYIFYENNQHGKLGFTLDLSKYAQYMRRVTAEMNGTPKRGDWRQCRSEHMDALVDDSYVEETVTRLRDALKK